jgi:hypothetical protein
MGMTKVLNTLNGIIRNIDVFALISIDKDGKEVVDKSGSSAVNVIVAEGGLITAVSGAVSTYMMLPDDDVLGASEAQTEVLNNPTGFKGIEIKPVDWTDVATLATSIIVSVSTTAGDDSAVAGLANIAALEVATPTGIATQDTFVLSADELKPLVILYDGTNTIKTVAIRLQGTSGLVNTEVVLTGVE